MCWDSNNPTADDISLQSPVKHRSQPALGLRLYLVTVGLDSCPLLHGGQTFSKGITHPSVCRPRHNQLSSIPLALPRLKSYGPRTGFLGDNPTWGTFTAAGAFLFFLFLPTHTSIHTPAPNSQLPRFDVLSKFHPSSTVLRKKRNHLLTSGSAPPLGRGVAQPKTSSAYPPQISLLIS